MRSDDEVAAENNVAVLRAELWYAKMKVTDWTKEKHRIINRLDHWTRHKSAVMRRIAELEAAENVTQGAQNVGCGKSPETLAREASAVESEIAALEDAASNTSRKGRASRNRA